MNEVLPCASSILSVSTASAALVSVSNGASDSCMGYADEHTEKRVIDFYNSSQNYNFADEKVNCQP